MKICEKCFGNDIIDGKKFKYRHNKFVNNFGFKLICEDCYNVLKAQKAQEDEIKHYDKIMAKQEALLQIPAKKICPKCNKEKRAEEFYKRKRTSYLGVEYATLDGYCIPCRYKVNANWVHNLSPKRKKEYFESLKVYFMLYQNKPEGT
jgi:hypothetical protein